MFVRVKKLHKSKNNSSSLLKFCKITQIKFLFIVYHSESPIIAKLYKTVLQNMIFFLLFLKKINWFYVEQFFLSLQVKNHPGLCQRIFLILPKLNFSYTFNPISNYRGLCNAH
jgi:hypothetical protein